MMRLEFSGWFQCRLATDPDPYDEPRGVSGYVNAYADEPDLDRILHWQPPPFTRVDGPAIGVSVHRARAAGATGATRVGLQERIDTLSRWLDSPQGPIGFFGVRMAYDYALRSKPVVTGWSKQLGVAPSPDVDWTARFWLGGWDADALCGFCSGVLEVPTADPGGHHLVGARGDDRDALMRRGRR